MGLDANILALLPDNTDEEISPEDLRNALAYITASIDDSDDFSAAAATAYQPKDADLTALAAAGNSTVLSNTTASFLTADETKLDGIEALADVTDAANVAAAGAVMESDTTTAAMSFVVDEDNMASDLATKVPTQQSTKAYVDAHTGDTAAAHAASAVAFTPTGSIAATDVQAAIAEVASEASGIPETLLDAKGDLIVASAADTAARLAVGTNGQILVADSAEATGIKWAAAAGGGDLLAANNLSDVSVAATAFTNIKQAASETATGVVELATTAEATTGTDTARAVTPAGVKAVADTLQPLDTDLTAIAGLTSAADKGIQFTGAGTAGVYDLTAAGKALLDDADASAQRTTLGLGTMSTATATDYVAKTLYDANTILAATSDDTPAALTVAEQTLVGRITAGAIDDLSVSQVRTLLGLATADSPEFTALNIGAATDTTLARSGAGDLTVEGNAIYRAGGTDVPVTDGGTGSSTASGARTNLGLVIGTDVQAYLAGLTTASIQFIIDGGGSAITTGVKGFIEVPFACTITQVTLLADQDGAIVVDIWKDTYANYPPTVADTITAAAKPTITATGGTDNKYQDSTLTGWTTTVAAGAILGFNVDSVTSHQRVTVSLKVTKT